MIVSIILAGPVFFDVFSRGISRQHLFIVGFLVCVFILFVLNTLLRKISVEDTSITIVSIAGKKEVPFSEIKSIDGISLGRRQYITISHKSKTYLIPNSFNSFPDIVSSLIQLFPDEIIAPGLKDLEKYPLTRTGDTIAAWITVLVLLLIIFVRFFSAA